jgi:cytochrome b subunit of formate dehydrogenase
MVRGTVEKRWAWTHHPAWYRAVTGRDPRVDYNAARQRLSSESPGSDDKTR